MTDRGPANDLSAFLSTFAALLLENVWRFEETANRVTDLVMDSGRRDRELIVTLQGFDRLKQEFEALGDALARYAASINAKTTIDVERAQLGRDIIAAISVADLKDRLLQRIESHGSSLNPQLADPDSAEVDVDVVF
ncbi:MAG TPA: hypothetical protein VNL39_09705 [Xanthobacteraceae bacterium]|nr:hypothetical protein [Xanthobacteraceae bacterium]